MIKSIRGQYKGRLGGLDKVVKIRDRHHRIRRQILRQKCRSYFDSSSKLKIFIFRPPFKGPKRSSNQIFTGTYASAVSRSTKPEIVTSLPSSVLSQSGPPSVGGRGGSGGGGVVYHTSCGQYIGVATFFLTRVRIGRKIDCEWSRRFG